jgi:hypothetical protein
MRTTLVSLVIIAGCAGSGAEPGNDLYTLDLAGYSPGQTPPALKIANETVVLPLGVGAREQTLSAQAPGELVALYTRIGCNVDPDEWLGAGGVTPAPLPATAPVHLVEVTVEQLAGTEVTASPDALASATCVSFRRPDGRWHASARSTKITMTGATIRTEFALDAPDATALAVFLPTYTYVSRVSYRVTSQ